MNLLKLESGAPWWFWVEIVSCDCVYVGQLDCVGDARFGIWWDISWSIIYWCRCSMSLEGSSPDESFRPGDVLMHFAGADLSLAIHPLIPDAHFGPLGHAASCGVLTIQCCWEGYVRVDLLTLVAWSTPLLICVGSSHPWSSLQPRSRRLLISQNPIAHIARSCRLVQVFDIDREYVFGRIIR